MRHEADKQDGGERTPSQGAPLARAEMHQQPAGAGTTCRAERWPLERRHDGAREESAVQWLALQAVLRHWDLTLSNGQSLKANHMVTPSSAPCTSRHIPSLDKLEIGIRLGQINIIPKTALPEHCVWNRRQKNKNKSYQTMKYGSQ